MKELVEQADEAVSFLKSFASRSRLLILCRLIEGEAQVRVIAEKVKMRESTVSQHLALLRRERLVSTRRDAQSIFYSLSNPTAKKILRILHKEFCD